MWSLMLIRTGFSAVIICGQKIMLFTVAKQSEAGIAQLSKGPAFSSSNSLTRPLPSAFTHICSTED